MSAVDRAVTIIVVVLLFNARIGAHTLAGTLVSVTIGESQRVMVTIAAEADPLIAKLEALSGLNHDGATTQEERRRRLMSLFPTLRAHIDARVDGKPLFFSVLDAPVDDTAQVEMQLVAVLPSGSTGLGASGPPTFTWRSSFIFGAYRLTTTTGAGVEQVEWLQGPQASTPITLEASADLSALRSTRIRIGHGLAMGALVMWVLHRRGLTWRRGDSS